MLQVTPGLDTYDIFSNWAALNNRFLFLMEFLISNLLYNTQSKKIMLTSYAITWLQNAITWLQNFYVASMLKLLQKIIMLYVVISVTYGYDGLWWDRQGVVDLYYGVGGGTGGGYYLFFFLWFYILLSHVFSPFI